MPNGVTVNFNPAQTATGATTDVSISTIDGQVPFGSFEVVVKATGSLGDQPSETPPQAQLAICHQPALKVVMELTRFSGHFRNCREGVHHDQTPTNLPARVSPQSTGVAAVRQEHSGAILFGVSGESG